MLIDSSAGSSGYFPKVGRPHLGPIAVRVFCPVSSLSAQSGTSRQFLLPLAAGTDCSWVGATDGYGAPARRLFGHKKLMAVQIKKTKTQQHQFSLETCAPGH